MKDIVPVDTRYIPFVQQKSCCAVASILMVMYKLKIPLISQELLGYHLGLTVADEFKHLFWNPRLGKKPPAGYGCRIVPVEKYNPNEVFNNLDVPLELKIWSIDDFKDRYDISKFIQKYISGNKDLLVVFNHGVLKGDNSNGGHVCVIDRIYLKRNIIRLVDPSPTQPKWREVDIDILFRAIKAHPSGNGSLWELNKI